jgi:glycerol-3-phosphate dehydrogenase
MGPGIAGTQSEGDLATSPSSSIKKRNKRFAEDVQKNNVEKIKEKAKTMDPNFWVDEEGTGNKHLIRELYSTQGRRIFLMTRPFFRNSSFHRSCP